jgi:glyoxylase-like metal-dependent hydrolase (beta-lactamase superfamily II)
LKRFIQEQQGEFRQKRNKKALKIKTLPVGQLATNCYLIFDDKTPGEAIIIDPGGDVDYIMRVISDLEIKPVKIIATHGHFDHILAVKELKLNYKIPFLMHKNDEVLLKWIRKSCQYFCGFDPGPAPKIDEYLDKNLKIGSLSFEVIETPGHTPGSVTLYNKLKNIAFVGDTVFKDGIGRYDFPYSDKEKLFKSIHKILKLPKETIIYPGHGERTTIAKILDIKELLL